MELPQGEHLNTHRLEVFLEIVDTGSVSAAAKRLLVSQPTVSKQLRQLEEELGTRLFDREAGRLRATDAGEVFAHYARTLIKITNEAERAVLTASRVGEGVLAIGATTTVGTYVVPTPLCTLRRHFPQIKVDLHIGNQQAIIQGLLSGSCTIGLLAGRPQETRLVQVPVGDEELSLVAGRRHRLAGRRLAPEQLVAETFLLREPGSGDRHAQDRALELWDLAGVRREHVGSSEAIKRLVESGHGLGLVSRAAVERELADGRLVSLDVRPVPPNRLIYAAYRTDHVPGPVERALLQLVRDHGTRRRTGHADESVSDARTAPLQVEVPHLR